MRVLYVGDFIKQNGPSSVDINLASEFRKVSGVEVDPVQINRAIYPDIKKVKSADVLHLSGVSSKGLIFLLLAKCYGKPVSYTTHGNLYMLRKINPVSRQRLFVESLILRLSNKIICVSEGYHDLLQRTYHQYKLKIDFVNNGIKLEGDGIAQCHLPVQPSPMTIVTFGGGRKDKGILEVCYAVDALNKAGSQFLVIVLGEQGEDTEKIKKFSFVDYRGFIPKPEVSRVLQSADIYIQNSLIETFCLSALEAIQAGCVPLLSRRVLLPLSLPERYYFRFNDREEISERLLTISQAGSQLEIDISRLTWANSAKGYINKWRILIQKCSKKGLSTE